MLSQAEVQSTGDLGEIGFQEPLCPEVSPGPPFERSAVLNNLSMIGFVLAIPITLIVITDTGILTYSFVLFMLVQGPRVRSHYRLDVEIHPKYNAALLLEKAKTGLPISEITERALNAYLTKGSK